MLFPNQASLGVLGDVVTIKKKPLFNILATGFHLPVAMLGNIDFPSISSIAREMYPTDR